MNIFKDQNSVWALTKIEYYIVKDLKVLWLCIDGDKVWAVNLGSHKVPSTACESNFLDILIVTGITQATLEQVYKGSQFGVIVSFIKGIPQHYQNILDIQLGELD